MALSALPVQDQERNLPPTSGKRFRNQLAAAVRSIDWSYAIYWSISTNRPGVLTWKDGFYNGEIKTRKLATSTDLTADQLVLQRSEQLRELYESLLSGECDHRARRPVASLSPEDLGHTEWYYTVCMTYAFRPGQGLPGRSFASNEHVWLCNAQFADTKTFLRALLAKTASIQTVVCIPFMGGVLELGTTDTVREDPGLVNRIDTSFWEMQYPACSEEPSSSPSANEAGEADIVFEDLDHNATMDAMISGPPGHELGEDVVELGLSDTSLERITREIDGLYTLCDELDVRAALEEEGNWAMDDGSFEVCTSSPEEAAGAAADDAVTLSTSSLALGVSLSSCFTAWKRPSEYSDVAVAVPPVSTGGEPSQKLLKKAVAGGAWTDTARALESCTTRNHVISERRRREKLNEMFLVLKSLVPSIHKVDKASILAETIAYLKELEKKVEELEASREQQQPPRLTETTGDWRRHDAVAAGKKVSAGAKRKASELGAGGDVGIIREQEHHWVVLSENDDPSNVSVTVVDKEVLLEVRCRWKELLMTRLFDAVKSLRLDVVSVQASTPDGLLALKIRAQSAGSAAVAPGMISEALQKAIAKW